MLNQWIARWQQRHAARIAAWQRAGTPYVGRFAPSPTGPLHAGSLIAALASYLDARAHGGLWLVRMEDLDPPREVAGSAQRILALLAACGLHADGEVMLQSRRHAAYQTAFESLGARGLTYPCTCTRKEIADTVTNLRTHDYGRELIYPGTCRAGLAPGRGARAWRLRVPARTIDFEDVFQGRQVQDLGQAVGDFVLKRADGLWAYQLAVVVDDAAQGITHVVRGADLLDSTPRQTLLQQMLGVPTPVYAHVDVLTDGLGEKLSKQTGAAAIEPAQAGAALAQAAAFLFGRHD